MTRFIFELAMSSTMKKIGELTQARDRSLDLGLNKGGGLGLWLPLEDELTQEVEEADTCVTIKMDNNDTITNIWSGPVWDTNKDRKAKRLEVGCVGWQQGIEKRVTKPWWQTPLPGALVYSNQDAGLIAMDLLNKTRTDAVLDSGPTYVFPGTVELTQNRTRTYQPWSPILGSIEELSQIESGFDMAVDPTTRKLNIYKKIWTPRPTLMFEYGANAVNVTTATDVSKMCNRCIAYSSIGYAIAEDDDSIREHGAFEEAISLTDVVDISILQAYANAEVAVRSTPMALHACQLRESSSARPEDPMFFRDFNLGDIGKIKVDENSNEDAIIQATRLFGVTIGFQQNGSLKLSNLQTSAEATTS